MTLAGVLDAAEVMRIDVVGLAESHCVDVAHRATHMAVCYDGGRSTMS